MILMIANNESKKQFIIQSCSTYLTIDKDGSTSLSRDNVKKISHTRM